MVRIGVISDTHGLLRPQARAALAGCDPILHAGDFGSVAVLDELSGIAKIIGVRGNNDNGSWAQRLPLTRRTRIAGVEFYLIHDLAQLDIDPAALGIRVVVSGHSHKPIVRESDAVLYVNPGSAGPRRFRLPVTVARIVVDDSDVRVRIVELSLDGEAPDVGHRAIAKR